MGDELERPLRVAGREAPTRRPGGPARGPSRRRPSPSTLTMTSLPEAMMNTESPNSPAWAMAWPAKGEGSSKAEDRFSEGILFLNAAIVIARIQGLGSQSRRARTAASSTSADSPPLSRSLPSIRRRGARFLGPRASLVRAYPRGSTTRYLEARSKAAAASSLLDRRAARSPARTSASATARFPSSRRGARTSPSPLEAGRAAGSFSSLPDVL